VPLAARGRNSEAGEQRSQGAPIDIKYLDLVPLFDFYEAIPAGAKDVNAAICFGTWYVTEAAPQVAKMTFSGNEDEPKGLPSSSETIEVDTPDEIKLSSQAASEIAGIWNNTP